MDYAYLLHAVYDFLTSQQEAINPWSGTSSREYSISNVVTEIQRSFPITGTVKTVLKHFKALWRSIKCSPGIHPPHNLRRALSSSTPLNYWPKHKPFLQFLVVEVPSVHFPALSRREAVPKPRLISIPNWMQIHHPINLLCAALFLSLFKLRILHEFFIQV